MNKKIRIIIIVAIFAILSAILVKNNGYKTKDDAYYSIIPEERLNSTKIIYIDESGYNSFILGYNTKDDKFLYARLYRNIFNKYEVKQSGVSPSITENSKINGISYTFSEDIENDQRKFYFGKIYNDSIKKINLVEKGKEDILEAETIEKEYGRFWVSEISKIKGDTVEITCSSNGKEIIVFEDTI